MSGGAHKKVGEAEIRKRNEEKGKELAIFGVGEEKKRVQLKLTDDEDVKKYVDLRMGDLDSNGFLKAVEYAVARDDYLTYLQLTTAAFRPTRLAVYLAKKVDEWVRRVERGEHLRICLSMPRQHGKSMVITERLPSYFVGRNPDKRAILTAYGADLAEQFGDANRKIAKQYWKKVFDIDVSKSQDNKAHFGVNGHLGYIHSSGIDGAIAGYGAALAIVDDPYKPKEAENTTLRELVSSSFKSTIIPTIDGMGSLILVIHTRFTENDLIGELSAMGGWTVYNIPCIAEQRDLLGRKVGEPLLPELGKDVAFIEMMIKTIGKRNFMAQYQGHPFTDNGELIKRSYFKIYGKNDLPAKFDDMCQSWDMANEKGATNDYTAGQVWGRVGANHYLIKRIKRKMDINEIYATIKAISSAYPLAKRKLVERRSSGYAVINTLNDIIGGFKGIEPNDSKVQRVSGIIPLLEAGNIYIPSEELDGDIEDFIQECIKFPNGKNDDQVDCMTQYLNDWNGSALGKAETNSYLANIREALRGLKV